MLIEIGKCFRVLILLIEIIQKLIKSTPETQDKFFSYSKIMEAQFHNFTEGAIAFVSSTLKFSTYKNFLKYIHKGYSLAKIRIFFFFYNFVSG